MVLSISSASQPMLKSKQRDQIVEQSATFAFTLQTQTLQRLDKPGVPGITSRFPCCILWYLSRQVSQSWPLSMLVSPVDFHDHCQCYCLRCENQKDQSIWKEIKLSNNVGTALVLTIALEMVTPPPYLSKKFSSQTRNPFLQQEVDGSSWKYAEMKISMNLKCTWVENTYIGPSISEKYIYLSINFWKIHIFVPQFLNTLANSLMNTPSCWLCMCSVRSSLFADS